MRPRLPLLFLAALPACSLTFGAGHKAELLSDVAFDTAGVEILRVEGHNGPLDILAGPAGQLSGSTTLYARAGSAEEAQARVAQMGWDSELEGGTLVLSLRKPEGTRYEFGASLSLSVPAGWAVDLDTSNGTVTVDGDFPKVLVATSNGRLDLRTDGVVRARTSNGRIGYRGASQDFDLRTSNGRVTAVLEGDFAGNGSIRSSNGRISVECSGDLAASVSMSTSNGSRSIEGPQPSGDGVLTLDTSNGSIQVRHAGKEESAASGSGASTR